MKRGNYFYSTMNKLFKASLVLILMAYQTFAFANWQEGAGYLELSDKLDRPEDGYCLDIPGAGNWVDFNVPLNAHNCKLPGLFPDGAVIFTNPGPIRFPAYKGCVTAAGLNGRSLPGAALMLKPCAGDIDARQCSLCIRKFATVSPSR